MKILLLLITTIIYLKANNLQDAIDKAPLYSTIKLSKGVYSGSIKIDKPISIVGKEEGVIISGDGVGSVVTINSSDVRLDNLTIKNSGHKMEKLDSAIAMSSVDRCSITRCYIIDTLYGIDMNMVRESNITDNHITSYPKDISLRGDALKVWYSHNNRIERNTIKLSRDTTITYSNNNIIKNNSFIENRFGIHISHSNQNILKSNIFKYNLVGVILMGAKDTNITQNSILSSKGASGIGLTILGVSNLKVEENSIKYNAKGIYIDTKYSEQNMQRYFIKNIIAYNKEAIHFHQAIKNNTVRYNRIYGNIDDIVKDIKGYDSSSNIIEFNYWDRYSGFDRDGDGIGDTTHRVYQYADQLWHYNHKIKFFYASPIISLLNFMSNLAPFIEPSLLLEDKKPLIY